MTRRFLLSVLSLLLLISLPLVTGTASAQSPGQPEVEEGAAQDAVSEDQAAPARSTAPPEDIEAIRVTGKPSEGTTQSAPEAITTFDQQQLDVMGIANVDSLALNTPALHVGQFGAKAMVTLRGVGVENITEVGDPAVGFEIDGVHMGRPLAPTFFDIERVDVLRGPQATNGGRQSNGGRIALRSKRPDEQLDALGDFQYGSYDQFLTRAAFNIPILDEKLMTRTTIVHEERDGYQEFRYTGRKSDNTDDADNLFTRFQVRSLLADQTVELTGSGTYMYQRGNGAGRSLLSKPGFKTGQYQLAINPFSAASQFFVACPPGATSSAPIIVSSPLSAVCTSPEPRETYSDEPSDQGNWQGGFTGSANWDMPFFAESAYFSDLRVALVGGYHDTVQSESFDVDQTNAPSDFFERRTEAKQYSLEFFVERPDVSNLEFKTGLYYFHEVVDTNFCFDANGTAFATDLQADQKLVNDSLAGYASGGYRLLEYLKLKGGLRYSLESKKADQDNLRFMSFRNYQDTHGGASPTPDLQIASGCGMKYRTLYNWSQWLGDPTDPTRIQSVYPRYDSNFSDEEWAQFLPSAGFEWEITSSSSLSFSFASSFKAGGFPLGIETTPSTPLSLILPYPAEEVKSYEISLKNQFLDNKLQLNLAAFWTDYDPFQICQLAGPIFSCEGDGTATSRGVEVEFNASPIENLTINGHFNFLDARVENFYIVNPAQRDDRGLGIPDPKPVDVAGNSLPKAPELAGSLGIQYAIHAERWGTFTPRFQAQAQSRTYFRVFDDAAFSQDPFVKFDVSLDWTDEDSRFTVRTFVNNVTDQDVLNFLFIGSQALGGTVSGQYMAPRTVGIRVGINYTSDWF